MINTYNTKTKNKINRKEKKRLRRIVCLLSVASFFKAAFMLWFFRDLDNCCQDNFDFAKTQISIQEILIWGIKSSPGIVPGLFFIRFSALFRFRCLRHSFPWSGNYSSGFHPAGSDPVHYDLNWFLSAGPDLKSDFPVLKFDLDSFYFLP